MEEENKNGKFDVLHNIPSNYILRIADFTVYCFHGKSLTFNGFSDIVNAP